MWSARLDGRDLHFHLAAINNQNFIMQDEETGSWWQQVSGEAIRGPLAGRRLRQISWDEVSFSLWRQEHADSLVLLPHELWKEHYESADWEDDVAKLPAPLDPGGGLSPRDLIVGLRTGSAARAYPWEAIVASNPIVDSVGGMPILIWLHADGRSLRCFGRRLEEETLELFLSRDPEPPSLVDAGTGSRWDFTGLATQGPLAGSRLERVTCLKDYWFDWKSYNPATELFAPGEPSR